MKPIAATTNPFGGILPKPEALDPDPAAFAERLRVSLAAWKDEGYRVVWLEVAIAKAALIPVAVEAGFAFHHSSDGYLMLTLQLEEGAYVPAHASHYIGAGGVVLNEARELLVVSEKYHRRAPGPPRYKLPGGALHAGEHLAEAVVREVAEETGVDTEFDALVCFRHWHGYRFGKSDIYFVCRLRPLSTEISIQEDEIAECRWMPVADYLAEENVSAFNKQIVEAALNSTGVRLTEMEGYGTPEQYEFFMPPELGRKGSDREQKLERQNQERLAAVYLDPTAQQLIDALYQETSIRWEDLPNMVEGELHDVLRSVVLLAGANLCEASPTRLRLSAYGDKLLATEAEQANSEVERQPVR